MENATAEKRRIFCVHCHFQTVRVHYTHTHRCVCVCACIYVIIFPWLWDLFIPVPAQFPGEHMAPSAITVLETIQTHKQSLPSQVPIQSWVKGVHLQVKGVAQGYSAVLWQPRLTPKTSWSKVVSYSHHGAMPWHVHGVLSSDIGTLRVVTARELVILSSSFMSYSMSVRWHRYLHGHAGYERHSLHCWRVRNNLQKPLLQSASTQALVWEAHRLQLG